jgi:hypothetical protein
LAVHPRETPILDLDIDLIDYSTDDYEPNFFLESSKRKEEAKPPSIWNDY